jgi:hypothetical protein
LRRRGHDFPAGQIAGIDAADLHVRSAGKRQTGRVAIADAPGMLVATTRASMRAIAAA